MGTKRLNTLSAKPTKWASTFKRFIGNLPAICLSVFDHFVDLALKEFIASLFLKPYTYCEISAV